MSPRRAPALGAWFVGSLCLIWLLLTTGYGAAAAAPGIDLGGAPLPADVSTDRRNPLDLPPGQWQATLDPEYAQYFVYQRRIADSRVHVGVLGAPRGESGDGLGVIAEVSPEGASSPTRCGDERDSTDSSLPHAVLGAGVVVGNESGSTGETCRGADSIRIEVNRGYSSSKDDLPYVIKVVEEAPYPAAADETEADKPDYTVPTAGEPSETAGAASFPEAPALDVRAEAVTVETTVAEGTERLWRVRLSWGDLPVVRVDVAEAGGAHAKLFESSGPTLGVALVDPLGRRLRYLESGSDDSSTGIYRAAADDRDPTVLVASGLPVRQANGLLPGDYWVAVAASPAPEDRKPVDIPVEVTVAVDPGEDEAPSYDGVLVSPDKKSSLSRYTPDRPFLVGEDTFSAVASGTAAVGDGWLTGRRWAGLGLGVASLACVGAGLLRLRSARGGLRAR